MLMTRDLWNSEYAQDENIASTFKGTVSRSVSFLLEYLEREGMRPERFLDLGCGRGRNSIPLGKMGYDVVGMDVSDVALKQASNAETYGKKLHFILGSMGELMPFRDSCFNVVMDITSFDILVKPEEISRHKAEVGRVLKPDGYFLYYDMDDKDPYALSLEKKDGIIYTPTGIPFKTYSEGQIKDIFDDFRVVAKKTFRFQDRMDGKTFDRSILCMIMKPKKTG